MYCSKCGSSVNQNEKFCGKCGYEIKENFAESNSIYKKSDNNMQENMRRIDILISKGFQIQTGNLFKSIVKTPKGFPLIMIPIPFVSKKSAIKFESDFEKIKFPNISWIAFLFPLGSSFTIKNYLNFGTFLAWYILCLKFSSTLSILVAIYMRFLFGKNYSYIVYDFSKRKITKHKKFILWIVGFIEIILFLMRF